MPLAHLYNCKIYWAVGQYTPVTMIKLLLQFFLLALFLMHAYKHHLTLVVQCILKIGSVLTESDEHRRGGQSLGMGSHPHGGCCGGCRKALIFTGWIIFLLWNGLRKSLFTCRGSISVLYSQFSLWTNHFLVAALTAEESSLTIIGVVRVTNLFRVAEHSYLWRNFKY